MDNAGIQMLHNQMQEQMNIRYQSDKHVRYQNELHLVRQEENKEHIEEARRILKAKNRY